MNDIEDSHKYRSRNNTIILTDFIILKKPIFGLTLYFTKLHLD